MRAYGWPLIALVAVAALLFTLGGRRPGERAETRQPQATAKSPVEPETLVKATLVHGTLTESVHGGRVFVQPLEIIDGDLRQPAWTTELIDTFIPADGDMIVFELPQGIDVAEVLVLAPGYLPATATYEEGLELDVELEPGEPTEIEVVDEDGRPFRGAELLAYASSGLPPHQRLVTGASGKAEVLLNAGGYVHVTAPGRTREEATADHPRVSLWPAFVLAGRVVDSAGAGIAGARLELKEGWADVIRSRFFPQTVSGPDGEFIFEHISSGDCEIHAVREGYLPGGFYGWSGQDDIEILLYRPASLSGRVVGANLGGELIQDPPGGRVEEDGRFALTDVYPGSVTLAVKTDEWIGELPVDVKEGDELSGLTIRVRPRSETPPLIRVRALGPDGAPRPGVTLWTTETEQVTTDARGETAFPYSGETYYDEVTVYFTAEGLPPHDALAFVFPPGDERVQEIRLPDWATARILLDPPGLPVALDHQLWGSARWVVEEQTDPTAGHFVFRVNPELTYELKVDDESRGKWIWPAGGQTVVPAYDGEASVRLRFLDASRRPLRDVFIEARDGRNRLKRGKRQEDGSYLLVPLWSGAVRVTAGRDRDVPEVDFQVELEPNEDKEPAPIVLPGYRWLTGVVQDRAGRPLGGVAFRREGALTGWNRCGASHPDGGFRVHVSKTGGGYLCVSKRGYGDVALSAKGNNVTVVLPPAGALELTVPARLSKLRYERELPVVEGGGRFFPREGHSDLGRILIEDVAVGDLRLRLPGGVRVFAIRAGEITRGRTR